MKNNKNISIVLLIFNLAFITSFCDGQQSPVIKINTNGYYCHLNSTLGYGASQSYMEFLYFFDDGTVTYFVGPAKSKEVNYVLKNTDMYSAIERWGIYKINNDTIRVQILIHDRSRIGKIPEEWIMTIRDSSTIYLSQTICNRCKNQYSDYGSKNKIIFQPMLQYNFKASVIKPDNSKMIHYYKRWIQKKID